MLTLCGFLALLESAQCLQQVSCPGLCVIMLQASEHCHSKQPVWFYVFLGVESKHVSVQAGMACHERCRTSRVSSHQLLCWAPAKEGSLHAGHAM